MNNGKPKYRPLLDRVIIELDKPEEKTKGGLYLADPAKNQQLTGKVLAVGPGTRGFDSQLIPMTVKKGDRVVLERAGMASGIMYKGVECIIVREGMVAAVEEK
jgi:chaperonin GroES